VRRNLYLVKMGRMSPTRCIYSIFLNAAEGAEACEIK
jgi:hypothetical protein